MAANPSFPFYASDWLGSNRRAMMTLAQQGAYINLLCRQWADPTCSLPDDDDILSRLSEMGEGWLQGACTLVRECFPPHPDLVGRIANEKLLELHRERQEWVEKSRKGGQRSAANRAKRKALGAAKGGTDLVSTKRQPTPQPNGNTPSPSPSPSYTPIVPKGTEGAEDGKPSKPRKKNAAADEYSERFLEFWDVYSRVRRTKKADAWEAWRKAITRAMPAVIIAAAKEFAASPEGRSKYCPGPTPWLNQNRWEDDRQSWQLSDDDGPPGRVEAPYREI